MTSFPAVCIIHILYLLKVLESEGQLKVSLMECDREREELERKCAELEREKDGLRHNIR